MLFLQSQMLLITCQHWARMTTINVAFNTLKIKYIVMNLFYKQLMMFALLVVAGWSVSWAQSQVVTSASGENFRLLLLDNISQYTADSEKNMYENKMRLQNVNITAADLNDGDNLFLFHRVDNKGTDFVFATLNIQAAGYGPRTVTMSMTYSNQQNGNDVLNYEIQTYEMTDTLDLYGIIDYVNDVFEVSTADNDHSTYYNYYVSYDTNVSAALRSGKDDGAEIGN